jgi:protein TonB
LPIYLGKLRRQIQQGLVYPAAARRLALTGQVTVAFRIEADGTLAPDSLRLVGGASETLLRDAALQTIRDIGGFPPPPGGAILIEVPVQFSLVSHP